MSKGKVLRVAGHPHDSQPDVDVTPLASPKAAPREDEYDWETSEPKQREWRWVCDDCATKIQVP